MSLGIVIAIVVGIALCAILLACWYEFCYVERPECEFCTERAEKRRKK